MKDGNANEVTINSLAMLVNKMFDLEKYAFKKKPIFTFSENYGYLSIKGQKGNTIAEFSASGFKIHGDNGLRFPYNEYMNIDGDNVTFSNPNGQTATGKISEIFGGGSVEDAKFGDGTETTTQSTGVTDEMFRGIDLVGKLFDLDSYNESPQKENLIHFSKTYGYMVVCDQNGDSLIEFSANGMKNLGTKGYRFKDNGSFNLKGETLTFITKDSVEVSGNINDLFGGGSGGDAKFGDGTETKTQSRAVTIEEFKKINKAVEDETEIITSGSGTPTVEIRNYEQYREI
ncbi:MAG: hypothetical protein GY830_04010 [Bacteroidetes bacterium]|nr:hypothetical protein [Bacteroidota bacterium]